MPTQVSRREIAVVAAAVVAVHLASAAVQTQVLVGNGKGWDGATYYGMAEQWSRGNLPAGVAPFVYRIGTPLLAALVPGENLFLGFRIVNGIAGILSAGLLLQWLAFYVGDRRIRVCLCLLFVTQWLAPIRFTYWYPTYVDPWAHVAILAGLISVHVACTGRTKIGLAALALTSFLGVAFREIVLLVPVALFLCINPFRVLFSARVPLGEADDGAPVTVQRLGFIAPLICGVLGLLLVRALVRAGSDYSFVNVAREWFYKRSILQFTYAWFVAFGPVLVIPLFGWQRSLDFLTRHRFMLVFLAGVACMGWVGGTDTERFLYWSAPVVYALIGRVAVDEWDVLRSAPFLATLGVAQAISQRIFWPIPAHATGVPPSAVVLTPIGGSAFDLFSFHADWPIARAALDQYLCLAVILVSWLSLRSAWLSRSRLKYGG